ncbi:MAG: hypothetical protein RLZ98_839 [Pseudomonadota bacterium]|jgi:uncharacterized protein GlcG (DUF336 family)
MLNIKRLSRGEAQAMLEAAEAKSRDMNLPMCIAVTDESGNLIAFSRMDGAKISSIRIAIDKAWTAAAARNPTAFYNEVCRPGHGTFGIHVTNEGHFCIIGGGLPAVVDGQVVGGIGVSSGTPDQDIAVAQAGIDAFNALPKG